MRANLTTSVNTLVKEAEEKIIHCEETNTFNEEIISYKDTLVEKIEKIKEYNDQIIDLETDDDLAQEEKTDTQFSIMCKNKLRFIDKFIGKHSIVTTSRGLLTGHCYYFSGCQHSLSARSRGPRAIVIVHFSPLMTSINL